MNSVFLYTKTNFRQKYRGNDESAWKLTMSNWPMLGLIKTSSQLALIKNESEDKKVLTYTGNDNINFFISTNFSRRYMLGIAISRGWPFSGRQANYLCAANRNESLFHIGSSLDPTCKKRVHSWSASVINELFAGDPPFRPVLSET